MENYNYPLAKVKVYAGKEHYFFSIDPVDLDIHLERISVILFKIGSNVDILSLVAYRLFLVSLTKEYDSPKYDPVTSKIVTEDIYQTVHDEIMNMPSVRTMIHTTRYYAQEDYYEYELMYSH